MIDRMFVYHSADLDMRVEIIFRKERAAENDPIDFEIGDIGTSALVLEVEENFTEAIWFFNTFLVPKNSF